MKTTSVSLINDLIARTQENLKTAKELKTRELEAIQFKAAPEKWSALECVDHINQYATIYISNISKGLTNSSRVASEEFNSNGLGNWFAKMMQPGQAGTKMKTFKSKNPNGKTVSPLVLDTLEKDQFTLLELLEASKSKNLKKTKVATDFGAWLSLSLGDSLRIIVYHNQRHLQQAQNSINAYYSAQKAAMA
ncbi:MAG: DinB family protein [Gilvibacter sp.]